MARAIHLGAIFVIAGAFPLAAAANDHRSSGGCKVRVGFVVIEKDRKLAFNAIDHSRFDALLRRFVDCEGLVSYRDWKNDCSAQDELRIYLESFSPIDWSTGESQPQHRMAALINAYNALAIYGILREYPTVSIQTHNREGAAYRIFDDLEMNIGGEWLSLNSIEHGVLRPLGDFRIHFAIVCAARGCPKLLNEAYTAERLEFQLESNGRDFFASNKRWRINRITKHAHVSPILKWFREDFGGCDCTILHNIHRFLPCSDQQLIARKGCVPLHFLGYNWALNDRHPPPFQRAAALPYTLYAEMPAPIRPLLNLIRPGSESSTPSAAPPAIHSDPQPAPTPRPGDEDAPPPRRLEPKKEENPTGKVDASAYCDGPMVR